MDEAQARRRQSRSWHIARAANLASERRPKGRLIDGNDTGRVAAALSIAAKAGGDPGVATGPRLEPTAGTLGPIGYPGVDTAVCTSALS